MKRKLLLSLVLFAGFSPVLKAQETVSIQTVYDEPYRNFYNAGVFVGLDVQPNSGGLYYGAAGRFSLAKIATFQANVGLDMTNFTKSGGLLSYDAEIYKDLKTYKTIDLRAVFHFKDEEGEKGHKVNLGSSGGYEYSTNYACKARSVLGLTASLNINTRLYSMSNDTLGIITIENAQNYQKGALNGMLMSQDVVMIGGGLHIGDYTLFKGVFSAAPIGTKTRRIKRSTCANIEFLFAPVVNVSQQGYLRDQSTDAVTAYNITDAKKKRIGFRISADMVTGKPGWYIRSEMGIKPGIESPLKSQEKAAKFFKNGFFNFAFGFGF